ncbi:MAG TPA: Holliday junction branch migration protein RuvA [Firmicutes bacterium]|nr:Holliday junction branch migration protein RuvA [Bacillota bacterium]
MRLFDYIRGVLIEKTTERAVLEVGGIGFALTITATTSQELPLAGETATIFTYLHVREDSLTLFGFTSRLERSVFTMLLDVGGIGPRTAQAVLSTLTATAFIQAVNSGDMAALLKVSGVGKKTAQRIILELKDKLRRLAQETNVTTISTAEPDLAAAALIQLGYTDEEVQMALANVESSADTAKRVRSALEVLRKR